VAISINCFLTCFITYWTSWCLKESHHLTHRGRTCPFALLGRAKCLFLQVKCYFVLSPFKLLRTERKEKGKLCKFCKGSTLFPHCTNLSCFSKRLLFARKLSIFETQHLSYLLLVLCMKHVLTRPRRAKGTTQQPEDGRGDLRGLTTEPPSDVQALYATIRDGVKKAWRTGLCGKVSKRGHLWNIMQGSCSMKALGCAGS